MNKLAKISVITLATLSLFAGCADNSDKDTKDSKASSKKTEKVEKESKEKEPFKPEDLGEGTFNIGSPSGNTADGSDIILFYEEDTYGQGLAVDVEGINDSQLTHIFVDGVEIAIEQLSHTQTDVILDADELGKRSEALSEGEHTIQLVQFSNADDTSSEPTLIKTQYYTVKDK